MPLSGDEDQLFRKLYTSWQIPRGQYKSHPGYLEKFTEMWNRLSGRNDSADDVYHYMETKQKTTKRLPEPWPTFNGVFKKLDPPDIALAPAHTIVLCDLYRKHILPLGVASDSLAFREDLLNVLARGFAKRTGLNIVGMVLASVLEKLRKNGRLPRLGDTGIGFDDLDELG